MTLVREGRGKFLGQFQSLKADRMRERFADPGSEETFRRSKLDPREREHHREIVALHRDLLTLRRDDPVLGAPDEAAVDGAVLDSRAFLLRIARGADDRLLIVNLGGALHLDSIAEPLMAPPVRMSWIVRWSSEDPDYGGLGLPALSPDMNGWCIPGGCALLFVPHPAGDDTPTEQA
jgi:maltooligosyltrehalose trehalohydrolase